MYILNTAKAIKKISIDEIWKLLCLKSILKEFDFLKKAVTIQ